MHRGNGPPEVNRHGEVLVGSVASSHEKIIGIRYGMNGDVKYRVRSRYVTKQEYEEVEAEFLQKMV